MSGQSLVADLIRREFEVAAANRRRPDEQQFPVLLVGEETGHRMFAMHKASGCGSVGKVVASYSRDPRFHSHQQYSFNCILENTKLMKKSPSS